MAFEMSNDQHKKLNCRLGELLDAYAFGEFTRGRVIAALAQVFTAAVIDNEGEVKAWIEKPEVLKRWRESASL